MVRTRQQGALVPAVAVPRADIVQSVVATGGLNAAGRIEIAAEITATMLEVHVREGDTMGVGQVMLRLQDGEARAALLQAQAASTVGLTENEADFSP